MAEIENKSPELEAIGKVENQIKGFNARLGEKADANEFTELQNSVNELKSGIGSMTETEINNRIDSINKGINSQVEALEEQINTLKEGGRTSSGFGERMLTDDAVKTFLSERKNKKAKLQFKAAETFGFNQTFNGDGTGVAIDAFTGREVDPILHQRKRKSNLILDSFNITPISVPKLYYLEKEEVGDTNPVAGDPGGADWILAGDPKPQRSFRVSTGEVEAKKVAIFANAQDKLLRDIPSFINWIKEDLTDEMKEAINDGLLNNDVNVNPLAPQGLKTNASMYAPTPAYTNTIETPNYIDDIIAGIASMAYNNEEAAVVYVSSDVYYRIHHLKATDGKYLNNNLVYINNMGQLYIGGVVVRPANEEDVPSTHLLILGAENGFKIRSYGNMVIESGLNGEDFREDKTSFRGYQEFLSYIPVQRETSVLFDTFANIETAISTI